MNEKIKALDPEKLLFLDIESVANSKELKLDSVEYDLYQYKTRNKDTGEFLPHEELCKHYKDKAALSPTFNKIVAITIGFISKGKIYLKTFSGEEAVIVENFYKAIPTGYLLCGHNITGFDLPVLRLKALKYGLTDLIPENINDSGKKPWAMTEVKFKVNIVDTMDLVKGCYFSNLSLDESCYIAGVPSPKNTGVKGPEVSKAYYEGRLPEIITYCEADIVATANLFLKLVGKDIIEEVIIRKDETEEELKPIQINILELLYTNKEFNDEVKIKVKEHLSKVKLTKKDLINVELMLYSLYINTKMFQSDKPDLLEEKKKEISEFVKSIK